MTARPLPLAFVLAGVLALSAGRATPQPEALDLAPAQIQVHATPIEVFDRREPERRRFGALEFRGGLELNSSHRAFGGFSGLTLNADGRFIAVSDRGHWLRGHIVSDSGRPMGIADAEMAPMLAPDGRPLRSRGWFDAESLAADRGILYTGIERANLILRFDYGNAGLAARGEPIPVPPGVRTLPPNQGLEALAVAPKGMPLAGALIAISERGLDASGNILGFLIGGPAPGTFTVRRKDDLDVTDAAITPDGDLIVLERHFSIARGVEMRIRRVALASLKPGAVIDGEVLIEAKPGQEIDNMEALAVHRNAAGELILTLLSDNNFSPLQRTILLQFALSRN